jgi:ABC transport system ATP-binding/permease protein
MSAVARLTDVHLSLGTRTLLDGVDFQLEAGERVALVGRNGSGKSTLLAILAGRRRADAGQLWLAEGARVGYLPQDVPEGAAATVYDTVAEGLGTLGAALSRYHALAGQPEAGADRLHALGEAQAQIEREGGWNAGHRVAALLTQLALPPDLPLAACSGGQRRLALLARALVAAPDVLLLDEPTNHLDIDAIATLETMLLTHPGAVVLVSHDRALVQRVAQRIVELDRGALWTYPGDYPTYLERRAARLHAETLDDARQARTLADEEVWLRQGIKARRTRNEGRVRRLQALRRERAARVPVAGQAALRLERGVASGQRVVALEGVSFGFDKPLVRDLTLTVNRGDRIAIIGPNGCGKSTLLRLMLGDLTPDAGTVEPGTRVQPAYFDQQRDTVDLQRSLRDNVADGADFVEIGGRRRHVVGYLGDFLFEPAQVMAPAAVLSGGERNRLLLARLFCRPANVLVLDEPTNDLDVETLVLLEDLIADYDGTILLVSHDRAFLDAVATSLLVFQGEGRWLEFPGGYSDWQRYRQAREVETSSPASPAVPPRADPPRPAARRGHREQRELAGLPARIEALEHDQQALQTRISESDFYRQPETQIREALAELERLTDEIAAAYERWALLESLD